MLQDGRWLGCCELVNYQVSGLIAPFTTKLSHFLPVYLFPFVCTGISCFFLSWSIKGKSSTVCSLRDFFGFGQLTGLRQHQLRPNETEGTKWDSATPSINRFNLLLFSTIVIPILNLSSWFSPSPHFAPITTQELEIAEGFVASFIQRDVRHLWNFFPVIPTFGGFVTSVTWSMFDVYRSLIYAYRCSIWTKSLWCYFGGVNKTEKLIQMWWKTIQYAS